MSIPNFDNMSLPSLDHPLTDSVYPGVSIPTLDELKRLTANGQAYEGFYLGVVDMSNHPSLPPWPRWAFEPKYHDPSRPATDEEMTVTQTAHVHLHYSLGFSRSWVSHLRDDPIKDESWAEKMHLATEMLENARRSYEATASAMIVLGLTPRGEFDEPALPLPARESDGAQDDLTQANKEVFFFQPVL